jgi:hypothetical protein
MKKLIVSSLLVLVGSCLFTSCTTVPRDTTVPRNPNATTTNTYSK